MSTVTAARASGNRRLRASLQQPHPPVALGDGGSSLPLGTFGPQSGGGGRRGRFEVKDASAYTGLNGSGYTLSGVPGRFLLPKNPVSSSSDVAGALDVWPAGKSTTASSIAQKNTKKHRKRRRFVQSQHDSGARQENGGLVGRKGTRVFGTPGLQGINSTVLGLKSRANASDARGEGDLSALPIGSTKASTSGAIGPGHDTISKPRLLIELEQFIETELAVLGLPGDGNIVTASATGAGGGEPSAARLQVYREAFRHFMDEFQTYKPFLSAVKNEYDSVLDKYARRLHFIPALRARLSTMEAGSKQRVRRAADAHAAEIRRIKVSTRAAADRVVELEKLNAKLIDDNVKITRELDMQRTRYLDMKTANMSIVASLKAKDLVINAGAGDRKKQEDRASTCFIVILGGLYWAVCI